jgi:hypothetical protein
MEEKKQMPRAARTVRNIQFVRKKDTRKPARSLTFGQKD